SALLPSAALMPPSAAPEWLRVGWSFETTATRAPASCASIAARMPAQPAPTTSTSKGESIALEPTECQRRWAPASPPGPAGCSVCPSGPAAAARYLATSVLAAPQVDVAAALSRSPPYSATHRHVPARIGCAVRSTVADAFPSTIAADRLSVACLQP